MLATTKQICKTNPKQTQLSWITLCRFTFRFVEIEQTYQLPLISQELTHALHSEKPYAETRTSERHNPRLRRNQL